MAQLFLQKFKKSSALMTLQTWTWPVILNKSLNSISTDRQNLLFSFGLCWLDTKSH